MLLDLATAVAAVNALIVTHPLLPADEVTPSSHGVSVHLHGGFADFEAWREALNIPVEEVLLHNRESVATMRADAEFAGVTIALVGYSSPTPAPARALKVAA